MNLHFIPFPISNVVHVHFLWIFFSFFHILFWMRYWKGLGITCFNDWCIEVQFVASMIDVLNFLSFLSSSLFLYWLSRQFSQKHNFVIENQFCRNKAKWNATWKESKRQRKSKQMEDNKSKREIEIAKQGQQKRAKSNWWCRSE